MAPPEPRTFVTNQRTGAAPSSQRRTPDTTKPPAATGGFVEISDQTSRERLGSTWIPGPIVVDMTIFLMYRPLAAEGLSRMTSSTAAA